MTDAHKAAIEAMARAVLDSDDMYDTYWDSLSEDIHKEYRERAAMILDAFLAALPVLSWQVVPVEATDAMKIEANKRVAIVTPDGTWAISRHEAGRIFDAMIAAAPKFGGEND
jgi:hypothetical protein